MINWDDTYKNNRDFQTLSASDLDWILSYTDTKKDDRALDIGCGTGQLARDLYHRGYEVLGIDISNQAIYMANQPTVYTSKGIDFKLANFEESFDTEDKYDLIICKYVYAFFKEPVGCLPRAKSLLSNNGIFIITPNIEMLPPQKKAYSR